MAFSSYDQIISALGGGQYFRADYNKLTHPTGVHVAGETHCLFHSAGNPTNGVLNGGTNLSFQSLCEESTGAIRHGGAVSPDTKHLLNASAFTAAATVAPMTMVLVDLLGYYPMSTVTTIGNQATIHAVTFTADAGTDVITHTGYDIASFTRVQLSTTTTLPAGLSASTDYWTVRQSATTSKLATSYANAVAGVTIDITDAGTGTHTITSYIPRYTTGAGVRWCTVANTALGAGTPNVTCTYTDADGNTGNTIPGTAPASKASAIIGHVDCSGTGAGKYPLLYPLAAGDKGVRSMQQLNLSATHTSGTLAWLLFKPILDIPVTTLGVPGERDMLNETPSLPVIHDGACLAWFLMAGAATPVSSAIYGKIEFIWD